MDIQEFDTDSVKALAQVDAVFELTHGTEDGLTVFCSQGQHILDMCKVITEYQEFWVIEVYDYNADGTPEVFNFSYIDNIPPTSDYIRTHGHVLESKRAAFYKLLELQVQLNFC